MNYYPFHLGDYAAHTAHLEPMEDLAYRRMLDLYYRAEKALPLDVQEIARLTRLRDHAATIRDVLNEFFTRSDDGWHSKRADDELTEMKVKQEQQATKDEHEAERLRRYRARRAEMFDALRAVGVVPAWDVAMKELQRLFDANCNAPETRTGPLSETDSQRLSLPTPTPTPIKEKGARKRASGFDAEGVELPPWLPRELWTAWVKDRKARGKPITEAGAAEQLKTLADYRDIGHDPERVIRHAIASGHQGLFPPPRIVPTARADPVVTTVQSRAADSTAELLRKDAEHRAEVARQRAERLAREQSA